MKKYSNKIQDMRDKFATKINKQRRVHEVPDHENPEFHNKNEYGFYLCYINWKTYKRTRKSSGQEWCIHCGTKIK